MVVVNSWPPWYLYYWIEDRNLRQYTVSSSLRCVQSFQDLVNWDSIGSPSNRTDSNWISPFGNFPSPGKEFFHQHSYGLRWRLNLPRVTGQHLVRYTVPFNTRGSRLLLDIEFWSFFLSSRDLIVPWLKTVTDNSNFLLKLGVYFGVETGRKIDVETPLRLVTWVKHQRKNK